MFLLSLLEDPATTLPTYDYTVPDQVRRQLEAIRDHELRYMAEKLATKVDLGAHAADKEFLLSMVNDPAVTFVRYHLPGNARLMTELDRLGDELLRHAAAAFRAGISPVADNFCEGCNICREWTPGMVVRGGHPIR